MNTNYTESEIRQKIENYKKEQSQLKEKSTNPFVSWQAFIVYILLIFLCLDFGLRLWRLPWGIGMGIIILIVLLKWGLPAMWRLMKENGHLKKRDKEKEEEIAKLHKMLENTMKK